MNLQSWLKKKKLPLRPAPSPALNTYSRFSIGSRLASNALVSLKYSWKVSMKSHFWWNMTFILLWSVISFLLGTSGLLADSESSLNSEIKEDKLWLLSNSWLSLEKSIYYSICFLLLTLSSEIKSVRQVAPPLDHLSMWSTCIVLIKAVSLVSPDLIVTLSHNFYIVSPFLMCRHWDKPVNMMYTSSTFKVEAKKYMIGCICYIELSS